MSERMFTVCLVLVLLFFIGVGVSYLASALGLA